ncbi:MAG: PGF-CTERM sorting domain-containing protein [Methanosarcinales archaeon]|nr:MAG: PGF-CTERM sorting domain-containing protein [Methanosarcinales archaeon]
MNNMKRVIGAFLVLLIFFGATPVHALIIEDMATDVAETIDYQNPTTRNFAVQLAAEYPGEYNIGQICSIYEHIRGEWRYVSDPTEGYYAPASESIENGLVGDCDDFAILMAATIEAIGGSSRVIYAYGPEGGHAYAEVFFAKEGEESAEQNLQYLTNKYQTAVHYHTDSRGRIWLNLDWTARHPGGPFFEATDAWAIYPNGYYEKIIGPTPTPTPAPPADWVPIDTPTYAPTAQDLPAGWTEDRIMLATQSALDDLQGQGCFGIRPVYAESLWIVDPYKTVGGEVYIIKFSTNQDAKIAYSNFVKNLDYDYSILYGIGDEGLSILGPGDDRGVFFRNDNFVVAIEEGIGVRTLAEIVDEKLEYVSPTPTPTPPPPAPFPYKYKKIVDGEGYEMVIPGFEAAFTIIGLLAVAYLLRRRR